MLFQISSDLGRKTDSGVENDICLLFLKVVRNCPLCPSTDNGVYSVNVSAVERRNQI